MRTIHPDTASTAPEQNGHEKEEKGNNGNTIANMIFDAARAAVPDLTGQPVRMVVVWSLRGLDIVSCAEPPPDVADIYDIF